MRSLESELQSGRIGLTLSRSRVSGVLSTLVTLLKDSLNVNQQPAAYSIFCVSDDRYIDSSLTAFLLVKIMQTSRSQDGIFTWTLLTDHALSGEWVAIGPNWADAFLSWRSWPKHSRLENRFLSRMVLLFLSPTGYFSQVPSWRGTLSVEFW